MGSCNFSNETLVENLELLRSAYEWVVPVMCTFLLVAATSDFVILFGSRFLRRKITPNLRLALSLAAADSCAALLMLFGLLVNSYLPVVLGINLSARFPCGVLCLELLRVSAMLSSALHLFVLAGNHFYSIYRPLDYKVSVTTKRCKLVVVGLWICPVIGLFVYFSRYFSTCSAAFYYEFPFRITVFLFFVIPLLSAVIIYVFVLRRLWAAQADLECMDRSVFANRNQIRRKKKAVSTTLLIVGTFGFSWVPCVLFFVLVCKNGCAYDGCSSSMSSRLVLSSLVNFGVVLKLTLNPLIYAFRIPDIRLALWIMTRTKCGRIPISVHDFPSVYRRLCSLPTTGTTGTSSRHKNSVCATSASRRRRTLSLTSNIRMMPLDLGELLTVPPQIGRTQLSIRNTVSVRSPPIADIDDVL